MTQNNFLFDHAVYNNNNLIMFKKNPTNMKVFFTAPKTAYSPENPAFQQTYSVDNIPQGIFRLDRFGDCRNSGGMESLHLQHGIAARALYNRPGPPLRKRGGVCSERHGAGPLSCLHPSWPEQPLIKNAAYQAGVDFAANLTYDEISRLIHYSAKMKNSAWMDGVRSVWNMLQLAIILGRK